METYHKIKTVFERNPETNYKTLIEGKFATPEFEYLQNNKWIFTEKVDGCLHYTQAIITDKGKIPIGRIVKDKLPVNVLSYNETTRRVEFKPIMYYHKEKRVRDFVCVEVKSKLKGNRNKKIVCTDNHKFYSKERWIEAKDLLPGQQISHLSDSLPQELKQIILGILLGDACIYRPSTLTRGFAFSHSISQSGYFEYKKTIFKNIFKESKNVQRRGGFPGSQKQRRGYSVVNNAISNLITSCCEKDGKKFITKSWAEQLTPLSLAFWYMDDGACDFNDKQRPRIRLATNGFSKYEVELLAEILQKKYNLEGKVADYKGWTLTLSADSTEMFFSLVFPYICDSMKYKLPKKYKSFACVLYGEQFPLYKDIIDTTVVSISNKLPIKANGSQKYQYDLSIADNMNYFTTQILVHNTNIRVTYIPDEGIHFKGKTDNAQIPPKLHDYLRIKFEPLLDSLTTMFPEGVCLYGEGYGAKIQKGGGKYRADQSFVLFDVKIENWWLNRGNVEEIANSFKIDIVPIVFVGTLHEMVERVKTKFLKSKWGDFLAEGLVARPLQELQDRAGKRIITKIKHKDFT